MRAAPRGLRCVVTSVLVLGGFGAPRPCCAETSADRPPAWTDAVTLNGFLSTSWSYNFNRPASGTNQLRVFDFDDDMFKLDLFELVMQRPAAEPSESGFRVDLAFGSSVPRVAASSGLFRDQAGTAEDIDLQQAIVSYVAPVGSGLRVDLGKFVTHLGYEVIEGYDGWNDNATRSFLFGYAIPFTHVGARASYTFSSRVSGSVLVVNGWDDARDNNRSKSVGGQVMFTPIASIVLFINGIIGPERDDTESDSRRVLDLVMVWKATSGMTLGANADWGAEENAVGPGQDGRWGGVAGYARFATSGSCAFSLRGEYFEDQDGARTGVPQRVTEVTATPESRITPHLLIRSDLRVDRSNRDVFEKESSPAKTQATVLLQAIYSF